MSEIFISIVGFVAGLIAAGSFATIAMILWVKTNFYDN